MDRARNELLVASSVSEYPISRNEQIVVISQKKKTQSRLLEKINPNMATRKMNRRPKKIPRRSLISLWWWW
jgi:hypothetical protein